MPFRREIMTSNLINTLRLSPKELHKLLEEFDKKQDGYQSPDREYVRSSFRVSSVELTITHSTGGKVTLPVATRNISKGGISILHSAFIHTGSRCSVSLKFPNGNPQVIDGKIVRCAHLTGRVHEIGISFDTQISTRDLLGLDPLNGSYSIETVNPDRLHGSILIVASSDMDCQLLLMFLEETNLSLSIANNIEDAISRAKKGADLVITDFYLEEETGPQLIEALRKEGLDMPAVVMTSDKSEPTLDTIREAQAAGILSKPISKDRLLQAIAEFLHADGDGGPLYTELDHANPTYPLVGKFLETITRTALDLEKSLREEDPQTCLKICRSLSGTGSPLGFPTISTLAMATEQRLAGGDIKSAKSEVRSLIVACRRIKAKPAA